MSDKGKKPLCPVPGRLGRRFNIYFKSRRTAGWAGGLFFKAIAG